MSTQAKGASVKGSALSDRTDQQHDPIHPPVVKVVEDVPRGPVTKETVDALIKAGASPRMIGFAERQAKRNHRRHRWYHVFSS
jgi:hypothetical protein